MRLFVVFITERGSRQEKEWEFPDRFDLPVQYRIVLPGGLVIAQGTRALEREVAKWRASQSK